MKKRVIRQQEEKTSRVLISVLFGAILGIALSVMHFNDLQEESEKRDANLSYINAEMYEGLTLVKEGEIMRKFYALTIDGEISYLGEHEDMESVMEKHPDDVVWYFDEESALQMVVDLEREINKVK